MAAAAYRRLREVAMDEPFCLVVNPAAGRGRSLRVVPEVTALLAAAGAAYQVSESASLDDARDIAARAARLGHVVVAVGGDGIAGVLSGVAASAGARYGIIPAGNGNDLARVLGIPAGATAAARVLTGGRERQVDLIAVGTAGQPETVVAGSVYIGIPSVAGEIANRTKWLRGPVVYSAAALRALAGWTPAAFRVEISRDGPGHDGDGALVRDFAGYAVVVANTAYFGAGMKVAPRAEIDDGLLDVVIMRHGPRLAFIRTLLKIKDGSHLSLPLISLDRGSDVTITAGRDLPAAADGENLRCAAPLRSGTPLRVRALPGALRALVPDVSPPASPRPGPPPGKSPGS
jgi:diacylglycerol kinase (ATP)